MQTHTSEHPEPCVRDPPQGSGKSSLPRHRHTDTSPVSAVHWRKRESRLGLDFAMEGRKTGEEGERASAQPPLESPAGASSGMGNNNNTTNLQDTYRVPGKLHLIPVLSGWSVC